MDFITDLPTSKNGNNAILVAVDALTKMAYFHAVKLKKLKGDEAVNVKATADIFRKEITRLHLIPGTIISDRDARWINDFRTGITSVLGFHQKPTTAYHSLGNGQVERFHTVLEALFRAYTNDEQSDWEDWLDICEFAYNDSKSPATGMTPFYANFGYHPCSLPYPEAANHTASEVPAAQEAEAWAERQQEILERCRSHMQKTQDNMAKYHDQHNMDMEFKIGDSVMLHTKDFPVKGDKSRKLAPRKSGPFEVIGVERPVLYRLRLPKSMDQHALFHVSKLEKHHTQVGPGEIYENEDPTVLWREKITEPRQCSTTPYKILKSQISQQGRVTQYKIEMLNTQRTRWVPRRLLGKGHFDDDIIDEFHTSHPTEPRPRNYTSPEERQWEDMPVDDAVLSAPRGRGRPKMHVIRDGEYEIVITRQRGRQLEYRVINKAQPDAKRWMSRLVLLRTLGQKGDTLLREYRGDRFHNFGPEVKFPGNIDTFSFYCGFERFIVVHRGRCMGREG